MNLFITNKLEQILLKQWSDFIDLNKLLIQIFNHPNLQSKRLPKQYKIKISRFSILDDKFIIWAEFIIENIEGFLEIETSITGDIITINYS